MNLRLLLAFFLLPVLVLAQTVKTDTAYAWAHLPSITEPVFRRDTFNIIRFGAVGDGLRLNTQSVNDAIAACSKKGGGVVYVPGGIWLTGPVEMKSNVNLHISRAAVLLFTTDFDQYPLVEGVYEGRRAARNQSPIWGNNLENIAITGSGVIDGNGDAWRMVGRDRLNESEWKAKLASGGSVSADGKTWFPSAKTRLAYETGRTATMQPGQSLKEFEDIKDFLRPNLVVFNNCKKVLLEGVTFQNSPAWCLHPLLCEDLTLRGIYAKNPDYAQNGDGVDVESCRNVLIENSTFDVGDDGICVKSGKDEEGRRRGKPTENMIVRNNIVYKAHGGFVIGSEMSGGARNIFVSNCTFIGTDIGLRFKTARGRGGVVENIYIKNIYLKDIVQDAILFDMYYFTKPPAPGEQPAVPPVTEATPQFRNFYIRDVVCVGAARGLFIRGLPEMHVSAIHLDNLTLRAKKGAEIIEASGIHLNKVQLLTDSSRPVITIDNSDQIRLDNIRYTSGVPAVVQVNGPRSGAIQVSHTDPSHAAKLASYDSGAIESMIQVQPLKNK